MIGISTLAGQRVALFGLGGSGLASARALMAGGARVVGWDDQEAQRSAADAAGIACQDLAQVDWSALSALVLAPGVPLTHPEPHWSVKLARQNGVEVIGDVELFCRERRRLAPEAPFVGITGTNGKSTTTALIAHILRQAGRDVEMGGNIGVPVLALEPFAPQRHYVVEVSSYQIDLAPSLDASVGVLLNITPDHIDRHGTFAHYAHVKERLVDGADQVVMSCDGDVMGAIYERQRSRVRGSGRQVLAISGEDEGRADLLIEGRTVRMRGGGVFSLEGIASLRGAHNGQNAMAAIAAARLLGCGDGDIQRGLETFPGLAHRMEQIGRVGRVTFVNDSKATNADSAEKALLSWERDIYWIAGGLAKEGGIETISHCFGRIAKAYLIGEAAGDFAKVLDGRVAYVQAGTLEAAVEMAARDAAAGGGGGRWCCFRQPAHHLTSSRTSKCGGLHFGRWWKAWMALRAIAGRVKAGRGDADFAGGSKCAGQMVVHRRRAGIDDRVCVAGYWFGVVSGGESGGGNQEGTGAVSFC